MSDESSAEKTEQPTPKKLRDARERGQVGQSKDVTIFIAIASMIALIFLLHRSIVKLLASNYLGVFSLISGDGSHEAPFDFMANVWKILSTNVIYTVAIVSLVALFSAIVNVMQVGGIVFSWEALKFDLNKFNPVNNFKQTFSMKNFVKFLKNLFEIIIISTLAYFLLTGMIADLIKLSQLRFIEIMTLICLDLLKILVWLLGCYFIFAIGDLWWEKYNMIKQLKMTKDEVEDESKETDGDPEIKKKRKELHRELVGDDGLSNTVKSSTLVLANPTHIAIVILFSPKRWPLPLILIKATDDHAQKIFSLARKHNIPIIREKYLARQLYELAQVGKFIPQSLAVDLSEVIKKNINSLPNVVNELKAVQKASGVSKI